MGSLPAGLRTFRPPLAGRRRHVLVAQSIGHSDANSDAYRVAIVGGGVVGLTSAVRLQEAFPNSRITIIADKVANETTSEGAAGLWKPYALSGTSTSKVIAWGKETFEHYLELCMSPAAAECGVFLCPAYELYKEPVPDPYWKTIVLSFRHIEPEDLRLLDRSGKYAYGFAYDTIIAEGRLYMTWLLKKLQQNCDKSKSTLSIQRRRIVSFADIQGEYDYIINCAGLGARQLANDDSMVPVRGHVLRVRAPWIRYHIEAQGDDDSQPCYIIPNSDTIVIGGTKQVGDEDVVPREDDRKAILDRAFQAHPSLAKADIVGEWVGLRPGRPSIRLEAELPLSSYGLQPKQPVIIHNYGHGGSGLTLAWGCAGNVVQLVRSCHTVTK